MGPNDLDLERPLRPGREKQPVGAHSEREYGIYDREHWLKAQEAFAVVYDLPFQRMFSDLDLGDYLFSIKVIDRVLCDLLEA